MPDSLVFYSPSGFLAFNIDVSMDDDDVVKPLIEYYNFETASELRKWTSSAMIFAPSKHFLSLARGCRCILSQFLGLKEKHLVENLKVFDLETRNKLKIIHKQ